MAAYRRIVSYLYKYSNGKKAENTGFVRAENREDGLRLQIQLKDLKMMDERNLKVFFYFHKEDRLKTIFVDEFFLKRGNCEYKKVVKEERIKADFDRMAGIIFCDEKGLLYGSCWDDKEIREEKIEMNKPTIQKEVTERSEQVIQEERAEADRSIIQEEIRLEVPAVQEEAIKQEVPVVQEETIKQEAPEVQREVIKQDEPEEQEEKVVQNTPVERKKEIVQEALQWEANEVHVAEVAKASSPMQELLNSIPKITLKDAQNFVEVGKLNVEDISKLSKKNWKLARNAFLQQGYEIYGYLLFGRFKLTSDRIIWILGVPGSYDNREKYLANLFGFSYYIPEEEKEHRTGGRGYWITQLHD